MAYNILTRSILLSSAFGITVMGLGQVEIHNKCDQKLYQAAVLGSTAVSSGYTPAHDIHTYNYGPIADGLSLKVAFTQEGVVERPFQFEVTRNYSSDGQQQVYYDVSSLDGNLHKHNRAVVPSDPDCPTITCPKNKRVCTEGSYHNGQDPEYNPVRMCNADATLSLYLCSLG